MFKVYLPLLLSFISFFGYGQNPEFDSLLTLATSQNGPEKIVSLKHLSERALITDSEQAVRFSQLYLDAAKEAGDRSAVASAYDVLGRSYLTRYDTEQAMSAFFEALNIQNKGEDEVGQAVSRLNIGEVYFQREELTEAEENFRKALEIAEQKEAAELGGAAMEGLGKVYFTKKIYGKSLKQYEQALQLWLSEGESEKASKVATRLGDISASLGDHESAFNYFQISLNLFHELGDQVQVARLKTRMAQALMGQKMMADALRYNQEALEIRRGLGDTIGMAENLKIKGYTQMTRGELVEAANSFSESMTLLESASLLPEVPKIYEALAAGYAKLGDYEKAFRAHTKYSDARDNHFNQEKNSALLKLTTRYESEFEAREKQAQIELLEVENESSRKISYFLFAMLGLLGLLLANLFFSFRRKQKDNHLLAAKNVEINEHRNEIDLQNQTLAAKNTSLDLLNKKLVDEIAERENIEKSSFARDRFLATMSHEMRTPLNVITGLTHILLESEPRDDQVEHLRTLQFSANDLVVFINDVLDFSKIEAGKLNLEDRPFQPQQVFAEVKSRFEEKAGESGILFNFFQDPKIPESFLGDDARLMQIVSNVLTNTFQHTHDGYVNMDVSLHELKGQQAMLKVVVEGSDGGVKRKILDEFSKPWQDEQDDFAGYEGQHFSLTITKRLVELQNGKMNVQVNDGESTAFVVFLPYKLVNARLEKSTPPPYGTSADLSGQHILVVEDNKINQLVVAKMLRKAGALVETANDGLEALELFDQYDFDLILMDIQMPKMDGYRATAEIRRHPNTAKKDVPIIALTASAFLTEKEKAVLFGMNDHVGKPFAPDELLDKIQRCLEIYRGV